MKINGFLKTQTAKPKYYGTNSSRGIQDESSSTITSEYGGVFKDPHRKDEFLKYLSLDI